MTAHGDMFYSDPENGITGWGYLPDAQQMEDRAACYIFDLEMRGFKVATILETRSKQSRGNIPMGDIESQEIHWETNPPAYESQADEDMATTTLAAIDQYRHENGEANVVCADPTIEMAEEAGYPPDYPHRLIAVMVRSSVEEK